MLMKSVFSALLEAGQCLTTVHAVSFPPPSGPFNTSISTAELVDHHRDDPFAPTRTKRALMASVFYPISPEQCSPILVDYIEPITAAFEDSTFAQYGIPAGTFESLQFHVCKPNFSRQRSAALHRASQDFPLVLFSPGLGWTRLFYSAMAQEISSFGYTVITIDHPYDGDIVVFPDKTTILGTDIDSSQSLILKALDTRRKDISFVLDQLSHPSIARKLIPSLPSRGLDTCKVGIYGHSLGGAAAAEALLYDSRLVGGVNLDGSFYGDVVEKGLDKPFLILAHEGKNRSTDPSWDAIWPKLTGWKRELELKGAAHGTFLDLPYVLAVLGMAGSFPSEVEVLLGNIDGVRAFEVVSTYVRIFFDFVLKGEKSTLLNGRDGRFPEVIFEGN